jgi:hypothetical protein
MKAPGFNAEASLYKTSGRYQGTMYGIAPTTGIVAQHYGLRGECANLSFETSLDAFLACYDDPPDSWACVTHSRCVRCGIEVR